MAAIYLPNLVQRIVLDPSGLKKGAAASKTAMAPVQKSMVAGSASAMAMGQSLNTLGFRAQTTGRMLMKYIAAPIMLIGGLSIKSFSEFEASMTKIEALVGVSAGAVRGFTADVKKLASETGRAPQELADAMFFVTSAGLRGAVATDVLAASAKAAAVGLGQTKVVADAATSAVNAYGSESLSGAAAVDVLTAAVREGKVEATQLAPAIGKAIPVASAMGIEFHEVAAAIASMTRTGTDARTSAIQLRQIMQSLLDPSRQTVTALKEMGVAEGELRDMARSQGLLAVLVKLRDLASENADAFADVFPNIRALAGALDITGPNLKENQQIFASLADSVGDTDRAFAITEKTVKHKMSVAMAELKTSFVSLGESLAPIIEILANVVKGFASLLTFVSNNDALAQFIMWMGVLAGTLGIALVAFGSLATTISFYQMASTTAAASTGVLSFAFKGAALSANILKAALIGLGIGVALIAITTLYLVISKLGKETVGSGQRLSGFRQEIHDVKNVGDLAVGPVLRFAEAIRAVGDASAEMKMAEQFWATFGDTVEQAGDMSAAAGILTAEESILQSFSGQGDSDEVRKALDIVVSRYQREFGDENFFDRLFGGADSAGFNDAITDFLIGENDDAYNSLRITHWAEQVTGSMVASLQEIGRLRGVEDATGSDGSAFIEEEMVKMAKSMEDVAGRFDQAMAAGRFEEAVGIWDKFSGALAANPDLTGPDAIADGMDLVREAFMTAAHESDLFTQDMGKGLNTVTEMMEALHASVGDEESTVLNGDFAGIANYLMFAEKFYEAQLLMARGHVAGQGLSGGELEVAILNLTMELLGVGAAADEAADGVVTVGAVLDRMEAAFTSADAAAKKMNDRFDNFIGRGVGLDEANQNFIESLQGVAGALSESGGAFDMYSASGQDARASLRDALLEIGEIAEAGLLAGVDEDDIKRQAFSNLRALEETAAMYGVGAEEFADLKARMNISDTTLGLVFATEQDEQKRASNALTDSMTSIIEGTLPAMSIGGHRISSQVSRGIIRGFEDSEEAVDTAAEELGTSALTAIKSILQITSPSKVFAVEVGRPITTGIAKGIMDGKKNMVNVIRQVVDDAIDVARTAVSAASRSISAVLDFGDAERSLDRLRAKAGGKGVDTRFEMLNQKKLERAVEEAKRNLRLGKGNQEDLELALMEAEFNLEDFQTAADTGDDVTRAELDLASAGLEVADAEVQMRMEGEKAITTFKSLAAAVGLTGDSISDLLDIRGDGTSIYEGIVSGDTLDAADAVGRGEGNIRTGGGGGGKDDDDNLPIADPKPLFDALNYNLHASMTGLINEGNKALVRWGTEGVDYNHSDQTGFNDAINNITNNIIINALPSEIASTVVAAIDGTTTEGVRTRPPATDPSKRGGQ
jgi:TP901 family phage tail tape measure protein